jgi:hypothetical protein
MRRTPQSRFEKLHAGMKLLMQYQPAAPMDAKNGKILIGNVKDENFPNGARGFLKGLGFIVDDPSGFFVFPVQAEKNLPEDATL